MKNKKNFEIDFMLLSERVNSAESNDVIISGILCQKVCFLISKVSIFAILCANKNVRSKRNLRNL